MLVYVGKTYRLLNEAQNKSKKLLVKISTKKSEVNQEEDKDVFNA